MIDRIGHHADVVTPRCLNWLSCSFRSSQCHFDVGDLLNQDEAIRYAPEPQCLVGAGDLLVESIYHHEPRGDGLRGLDHAGERVSDKGRTQAPTAQRCGQGKPGQEDGRYFGGTSSPDLAWNLLPGNFVRGQRVVADNCAGRCDPDPRSGRASRGRRTCLVAQPVVERGLHAGESADVMPLGVEAFRAEGRSVSHEPLSAGHARRRE